MRKKGRKRGWAAGTALALFAVSILAGCRGAEREADFVPEESRMEAEAAGEGEEGPQGPGETADGKEGALTAPGASEEPGTAEGGGYPGSRDPGFESLASGEETGEDLPEDEEETFVQHKIVVATDLHYLAEELAGNRCQTFMDKVEKDDGRVLQYGWEILDAFLDDMLEEKPELVILSGDLTLDGERESHEELAEKLEVLLENDIAVVVIPGNHDINNPSGKRYTAQGTEKTEWTSAEDFDRIYSDFGYVAADSRDPSSLSYLYKLDDYYWLLMLDTVQYEPVIHGGGMIREGTYEWMEEILEESWEQGAQVIPVTHHNLLEQSGVSRAFYDECTIEHNEVLIRLLEDYDVRLHLSGHLHIQHYMQDEDSGIYEIITGSLVMAPCQYGVLKIWNDGTLQYDTKQVDVDGWAKRNSYSLRDLADFKTFSENFLFRVNYRHAVQDLLDHMGDGKLFLTDERMDEMARFYGKLCVYYYGGRMYEIADEVKKEEAYGDWEKIGYISDLSDLLQNILEDEAKDFSHLSIPY